MYLVIFEQMLSIISFMLLIRFSFFFNFILFLNLKHCISFAKHQNESVFKLVSKYQENVEARNKIQAYCISKLNFLAVFFIFNFILFLNFT